MISENSFLPNDCPTGQDRQWHYQVLAFLCAQVSDIQESQDKPSPNSQRRVDLSMKVARHSINRKYVAEKVRTHESLWVKQRTIPESGHGKKSQISCMLEDLGTCLEMEQYIASARRHANSHRPANMFFESTAITLYLVSAPIRSLLNC